MNNMVFVDGRYRRPGSKYMSYTMTPRSGKGSRSRLGSSRSSRRSSRSKSQKSVLNLSRKSLKPDIRSKGSRRSMRSRSSTKSLVGRVSMEFKEKKIVKPMTRNMLRSRYRKNEHSSKDKLIKTSSSFHRSRGQPRPNSKLSHNRSFSKRARDEDRMASKGLKSRNLETRATISSKKNKSFDTKNGQYKKSQTNRTKRNSYRGGSRNTRSHRSKDTYGMKRYLGII